MKGIVLPFVVLQVLMAFLSSSQAAITCSKALDIVFILDTSADISPAEFAKEKQFIKDTIHHFHVDPYDGAKIGLVISGGTYFAKNVFFLDTFDMHQNMFMALDFAVHQSKDYVAWSHLALRQARKEMFTIERGSRLGENPLVVVYITGSRPAWPLGNTLEGSFLEQAGITTFAIGIGRQVTKSDLTAVSIDPKRSLLVDNVDELNGVSTDLANLICRQRTRDPSTIRKCESNPKADIAFALGTRVIREGGLTSKVMRMLNNLARRIKVGPDGILMSVLPEYCFAPGFKFKDHTTKEEVVDHFDHVEDSLPTAADLIREMMEKTFTPERGSRPDARHLGVVMVDTELQEPEETLNAAREAKEAGIELYVIGVGRNITYAEVEEIASTPTRQHVTMVDNYCTVPSVHFKLFDLLC